MGDFISFEDLQTRYGVDPDEFNTDLSTVEVLDETDVARLARQDRMAWDRTGATFDKQALQLPPQVAVVEFGWGFEGWHQARDIARIQAMDLGAVYPQLIAVEPVYAAEVMRYYFTAAP